MTDERFTYRRCGERFDEYRPPKAGRWRRRAPDLCWGCLAETGEVEVVGPVERRRATPRRRSPSSSDRSLRRRALAAAVRGDIPRFDVTKRALYHHLRDGVDGLDHETALLLAEAFGISSSSRNRALSRALTVATLHDVHNDEVVRRTPFIVAVERIRQLGSR